MNTSRAIFGRVRNAGIAAAVAAAVLAPGAAMAGGLAAGQYDVGFVTEKTGPIAAAGVSFWRGAELAAEEISKNEWMGKGTSIKLIDKESGSDAARSVQALSQFAADRDIIGVSCCILSPVAGAMRPVATSAKIPLVLYGATKPGLPELPYVTSIVALPGVQEERMTKNLIKDLKPKTVTYFVNADNDAFQGRFKAAQKIMEAAGVKTGQVISILSSDTDFTAPATQAIATKPDLIMVWTTQTPAIGIITSLRARGYKGHISASDVLSPEAVFKKAGAAVAGVPFPILFAPSVSNDKEAQAFVKNYDAKYGGTPDTYSAEGYTAIYYMAQGLRSIDGKPTRESLAQALASIKKIDHNVYGGLPMVNGQAQVDESLIVAWTPDGKLARWEAK